MSVRGRISPLRDERGISAVFLGVTMVALFAVGALAIDAGSVWTARRNLITGTDAAALDAARYFLSGAGDPCTSGSISSAESHAANVLLQNNSEALHDPSTTPDGFEVKLASPCTGGFVAGKVRFDGRLDAHQTLSSIIGIQKLEAFSSSTAAWGYITGLGSGSGLRPINICDQSSISFHWLPEEWRHGVPKRPSDPVLYPDLAAREDGKSFATIVKRSMEIVGSLVALVMFSPVFLLVAAVIKITSKGPIIFRQERMGQFGTPFTCLKFRSMCVNNDPRIHEDFMKRVIHGEHDGKEASRRDARASSRVPHCHLPDPSTSVT